ncbi:hypothetical protein JXA32_17860 [Candidatus Sumerlaeota bacterium]|nr:hypothetical protein [Candidatus Sumerlaeota bacterium]
MGELPGRPEWIVDALNKGWRFCCGVDLSGTGRKGNVIFCGAVSASGSRVPVEVRCGKWSSPELARQLDAIDALYGPEIILVENNGYQRAFQDWAAADGERHAWWGRVKGFVTGRNKANATLGLPGLEVEFENGVWRVPRREFADHGGFCDRGPDGGPCGWCRWVEEMESYPHVGSDDTVMACWFFREACRLLSGSNVNFRRARMREGEREMGSF